MVVLIVKLRVQPGTEEECKGYMRIMEKETRKEPGCLMYIGHQSSDDPTRLHCMSSTRTWQRFRRIQSAVFQGICPEPDEQARAQPRAHALRADQLVW